MLLIGVDFRVIFSCNALNFNAFIVFILAFRDVFFYGGVFVVKVFSYAIVYQTCSASTNVLCIAVVTCDLVDGVSL